MSRIGKKPVPIPDGVEIDVDGQRVSARGPAGRLDFVVHDLLSVSREGNALLVRPESAARQARALWGMSRTRIANMVLGVHKQFSRTLVLNGVGYRARMNGDTLVLMLGYSHDIDYRAPDGVTLSVPRPAQIVVTGIDKQQVGQVAAEIRAFRPPEPYKGKGVRYDDEFVFRKEGKKK